ncbi:MAG: hypothetical protein DRP01_10260 [Archaeoglobales archaeon]|nr:MAG: hypothetical protein DRP01_10260 [Archaeoglobales archaeon]
MKIIHIVPLGTRCDLILESIRMSRKPVQKAYLIVGEEVCLDRIVKALKDFVEVEVVRVDGGIYNSSIKMLEIIRKERDEGNEVYVNLSDASRDLCIAGLISAQISKSEVYMASDGDVIDLKIPPIKSVGEDKVRLIKVLEENGGEVESINRLIELVEGKTEDQRKYMAQRARMSYHLKGLEEDGLIETRKEGKSVRIRLTPLGKAYAIMF